MKEDVAKKVETIKSDDRKHVQVHLKKLEYREKVHYFFVPYFKKWNFHIF